MADISDACNVLVGIAAGILYPNGTAQPQLTGCPPCVIYQGWPLPDQLQTDLEAGKAHVSVYPRPEEHNTTRYQRAWRQTAYVAPTLTLTISGQTVTVGGAVPAPAIPQNLCVNVNGQPYVYAAQVSDTPTSIATALATLIAVGAAGTTNSGPVITLPAAAAIGSAVVGGSGTLMQEVKRQERLIQIGIWSPTPAFRDAIAQAIDPVLAGTDFISLPDGSSGRLVYKSSPVTDGLEKEQLYRRDLMYTVEFGTLQSTAATEVVAVEANFAPAGVVLPAPATPSVPEFVTVNVTSP